MRVLFVSHCAEINGAPKSMIGLICEMRKRGIEFLVALPEQGSLKEELEKNDIPYCVIKAKPCFYRESEYQEKRRRWLNEIYNLKAVYQMVKLIKEYKPDIVHSNSYAVDIGAFAAYLTGTPHVWHFREFMKEDYGFVHNIECKERWLAKKSQSVIAVSKAVKRKYERAYGIKKIRVVYNGINKKDRMDKCNLLSENGLNMIISGTVCEAKGQKDAIGACEILVAKGYKNIQLYIAGSGIGKYIAELKRERNKKGLSRHVKFLGFQSDMKNVRKDMDVELVCSRSEAFGRVTIEAMLADMLVIGANTGGTKELIQDGITGLLYQQGNASDLADKIEKVLINRQQYVECVRNGKKMAIGNFDIVDTADKVYRIYCESL